MEIEARPVERKLASIAMAGRSRRQPETRLSRDAANDKGPATDPAHRENQESESSFFYANLCLGFFPVDPLDFHAFAKGQVLALAIFVPAAIGLFIFLAL
jgi:hypothetical protein